MNFKLNSRPLFTTIFKLENYNFNTGDFSACSAPAKHDNLQNSDGLGFNHFQYKIESLQFPQKTHDFGKSLML